MAVIQISRPVSNIVAKNLSTGQTLSTNSDFVTLYQAVIDSFLTGGRTEQDTILCFGDFSVDGVVNLDSLLKCDHTGANFDVVGTVSVSGVFQSSGKNTIDIIGGTIECNDLAPYGIFHTGSTAVNTYGVKIRQALNHGVNYTDTTFSNIQTAQISDCGDDCVTLLGCTRIGVSGNILDVGGGITGGSHGVEVEGIAAGAGSTRIIVANNLIFTAKTITSGEIGGILVDSNSGQGLCSHITIIGNIIQDMPSNGIKVRAQGTGDRIKHVTTGGNVINNCGATAALFFDQVQHVVSTGDMINGVAPAGQHGIEVIGESAAEPSKNVNIIAPVINSVRRNGIFMSDVVDWTIDAPSINAAGTEEVTAKFGIQISGSTNNFECRGKINNPTITDDQGSPTSGGIRFENGDFVDIEGGSLQSTLLNTITANSASTAFTEECHVKGLRGYKTEKLSTASKDSSSAGFIQVTHGLARTPLPGQLSIYPEDALAAATVWRIPDAQLNATTFRIVFPTTTDVLNFRWSINASGSNPS